MSVVLKTERLLLRAPLPGDVPEIVRLLGDFDVAKGISSAPHPYTDHDGHAFVERAARNHALNQDFAFAVLRKADDAFIGACGVHPKRGWEIGYWFGKPYWGQGYATEAVRRVIAFAFEELGAERLVAKWYHDNPASGRVLEKLGFAPTGEDMTDCVARGQRVPSYVTALDRTAYKTRKNGS